ncbi:MAG: D-alanyl-D-alanine carboxypeptidase [Proteobacteria bacterium]|nr:D-alanyl-D-alanine carboxypeptidase [Pseudomonadota bacterium]
MENQFLKTAGALCLSFVLAAGVIGDIAAPPPAAAHHNNLYYDTSSIVIDADSGHALYARSADARRHPASLAKVMTLIVAFDAIRAGKINLDYEMKVPRAAAHMERGATKLGLREGEHLRVKKALSALTVKSANDVAITLATAIGGSEKNFAKMMNAKANKIGLPHTHFENATGLHDPGQVTTARDMAKLAQYLIHEYPGFYEYFSRQSFEHNGKPYNTHNYLMNEYEGMDGIKTGYVRASGHNLVSSAVRGGKRLIGVVFGRHSREDRDRDMAALLDKGFRKLHEAAENDNQPTAGKDGAVVIAKTPAPQ